VVRAAWTAAAILAWLMVIRIVGEIVWLTRARKEPT